MNKLYYGDNLDVLRKFVRDETIDLCYIDPPFNSKRSYSQTEVSSSPAFLRIAFLSFGKSLKLVAIDKRINISSFITL